MMEADLTLTLSLRRYLTVCLSIQRLHSLAFIVEPPSSPPVLFVLIGSFLCRYQCVLSGYFCHAVSHYLWGHQL